MEEYRETVVYGDVPRIPASESASDYPTPGYDMPILWRVFFATIMLLSVAIGACLIALMIAGIMYIASC